MTQYDLFGTQLCVFPHDNKQMFPIRVTQIAFKGTYLNVGTGLRQQNPQEKD